MPKFKLSGFSRARDQKVGGSSNCWATDDDINGLTAKYAVVETTEYSSLEHRSPILSFHSFPIVAPVVTATPLSHPKRSVA